MLAALAVLLWVWFAPLPPTIFGEEHQAAVRLPETRRTVSLSLDHFNSARDAYYAFVHTHDMEAMHTQLLTALDRSSGNPANDVTEIRRLAAQVRDFTGLLSTYASAGEDLFPALRNYDRDLMSYTRTLGPPTDELRKLTFPLADHLRLYPPPVGDLAPDPPWVDAATVARQLAAMSEHLTQLQVGPDLAAMRLNLRKDVDDIWESGRSIERVESLHTIYANLLHTYDAKVVDVARESTVSRPESWRRALAYALNIFFGAVLAAGVFFLLVSLGPRARSEPTKLPG